MKPEQNPHDETVLPSMPALAGLCFFALLFLLHVLSVSSLTSNLDDIKYLTLWIGAPLLLLVYLTLSAAGLVRRAPLWIWASWAAFLGALVLSTLFGAADYAKWLGWRSVATAVCALGWFFMAFAAASTVRSARSSLRLMCVVGLLTTGFGAFHYLGGFEFLEQFYLRGFRRRELAGERVEYSGLYSLVATFAGSREMMSTILNRQFFGVFLAGILPLPAAGLLLAVREGKSPRDVLFHSATLLLVAACMVLTFSKAAIGTLGLGVVLFPLLLRLVCGVRIPRPPAWQAAVGLGLLVAATALWFVRADLLAQIGALPTSLRSRGILLGAAWSMFAESPLFGTGPGSYLVEFPAHRSPDYHMWAISNVTLSSHNWIMDHLGETGLAGALPWFVLVAGIVVSALGAARRSPSVAMRVICAAFATATILLLAGNLLTTMYRWPIGIATTAVLLGMTAGVSVTAMRGNEPRAEGFGGWTAPAVANAVLAVAVAGFLLFHVPNSVRWFAASMTHQDGLEAGYLSPSIERSIEPEALAFMEIAVGRSAEMLERAVELEPTFLTSYYKLAHAYNRLGGISRIRYLSARGDDPSPEDRAAMAAHLDRELMYQEKSFETYDRLAAYAPNYAEIHYNRALLHLTVARDCNDAIGSLALEGDARAHFETESLRHYERGAQAAERAMEFSDKISVHFLAADIYSRGARAMPEGSEKRSLWFRRAGEISERTGTLPLTEAVQSPGQRENERDERLRAMLRAPEMYYLAKDWDEGARAFEALIREFPGATDLYKRAIDCHMRGGSSKDALAVVDGGLDRNPLNTDLLLLRAEVLLQQAREGETGYEAAMIEVLAIGQMQERMPGLFSAREMETAAEIQALAEEGLRAAPGTDRY